MKKDMIAFMTCFYAFSLGRGKIVSVTLDHATKVLNNWVLEMNFSEERNIPEDGVTDLDYRVTDDSWSGPSVSRTNIQRIRRK